MLSRVNLFTSCFFPAFLGLVVAANALPATVPYTEGIQLFEDVIARGDDMVIGNRAVHVDNMVKREPEAAPDPLPGEETDVGERFCRFGCL